MKIRRIIIDFIRLIREGNKETWAHVWKCFICVPVHVIIFAIIIRCVHVRICAILRNIINFVIEVICGVLISVPLFPWIPGRGSVQVSKKMGPSSKKGGVTELHRKMRIIYKCEVGYNIIFSLFNHYLHPLPRWARPLRGWASPLPPHRCLDRRQGRGFVPRAASLGVP